LVQTCSHHAAVTIHSHAQASLVTTGSISAASHHLAESSVHPQTARKVFSGSSPHRSSPCQTHRTAESGGPTTWSTEWLPGDSSRIESNTLFDSQASVTSTQRPAVPCGWASMVVRTF
jgi:hypothetical protein